jgi:hypothetical protein
MNIIPETLRDVLTTLNVSFAAIADLPSCEIQFLGDPKAVDNNDLISTLFADSETIQSLNRSLEGQILPRTWNQGKVSCIVCKPTNETIVGLFVIDESDAVQQYHWSKKADEAIRLSFSTSGS